ncbi:MAG: AAA family ATPase, partial [Candidatus Odinarchaeia archaeon]
MVFIKKIEMKGFKSFGNEKVTLKFPKGFTAIVGPNGSGKCVTGNTEVVLEGNRRVNIGALVEQKIAENQSYKISDGFITYFDGTKIASLQLENGQLTWAPIIAYVKREAPKKIIQIRTESGHEVEVTPYHPIFTFKDDKFIPLRTDKLNKNINVVISVNAHVKKPLTINKCDFDYHTKISEFDLYLEKIKLIKFKKPESNWVYDLCVMKDHNFIANQIIVHNSNILDAFCFVLGQLSAKTMRAGVFSDLLFTCNNKSKCAKSATVTLHLDNSDRGIQLDSKNVVITRSIDSEGKGVYQINGRRVTRSQLIDILSLAGISPDGYNIVLQGQLAQMISMTPLERRVLIEKISGIAVYDEKKEKAKIELDKADKNLSQIELLLKEISSTREKLKKDKEDAEKWMALTEEIKKLEANIIYHEINELSRKREESIKRLKGREKQLEELNLRLDEITEARKNIQLKLEKIEEEINQIQQEQLNTIHQKIADTKSNFSVASSELKYKTESFEKTNNTLKKLREELEYFDNTKVEYQLKIRTKEEKINSIKKEINQLNAEINKISDIISNLNINFEEYTATIRDLRRKIDEKETKLNSLIIEKEKTQGEINTLKDKIKSLQEIISSTLTNSQSIFSESKNLEESINRLEKEFTSLEDRKNELEKSLNKISHEIKEKNQLLQSKKEYLIEVKTRLNALKDKGTRISARKRAVKALIELKNQKIIEGVYGTIAELGVVKSEYLKALEVAAGGQLDYIIVKDDETA